MVDLFLLSRLKGVNILTDDLWGDETVDEWREDFRSGGFSPIDLSARSSVSL